MNKNGRSAQIRNRILQKTGIDFEKYKSEKVVSSISDLAFLPQTLPISLALWVIGGLALFIAIFFSILFTDGWQAWLLHWLVTLPLFLISFLLFGLAKVVNSTIDTAEEIVGQVLKIAKSITADISTQSRLLISNSADSIDSLTLPSVKDLIEGSVFVVLVPTIKDEIENNIKFIGPQISKLVDLFIKTPTEKAIELVSRGYDEDKFKGEFEKKKSALATKVSEKELYLDYYTSFSEKVNKAIDSSENSVIKTAVASRKRVGGSFSKYAIVGLFASTLLVVGSKAYFKNQQLNTLHKQIAENEERASRSEKDIPTEEQTANVMEAEVAGNKTTKTEVKKEVVSAESIDEQPAVGLVNPKNNNAPVTLTYPNGPAGYIKDKTGVMVWNNRPLTGESCLWEGESKEGLASGYGKLTWYKGDFFDVYYEGTMIHGRFEGKTSSVDAKGNNVIRLWKAGKKVTASKTSPQPSLVALTYAGGPAGYVKDRNGVLIWNNKPLANESSFWDGDSLNGYASGYGKLTWLKYGRFDVYYKGTMSKGKFEGETSSLDSKGNKSTRYWKNGKKSTKGPTGVVGVSRTPLRPINRGALTTSRGTIGNSNATFDLSFSANGANGRYYYPGVADSVVHSLEGSFNGDGKLVMKKFSNNIYTADVTLSCTITVETITWSGVMKTKAGKSHKVKFSRRKF